MNLISESYSIVKFLFNINDLRNLKSIFQHGILSKNEKMFFMENAQLTRC